MHEDERGLQILYAPGELADACARPDWAAGLFAEGAARAGAARRRRSWRQAASTLKGVAAAWLDPHDPLRMAAEAGIAQQTGQAQAMVRHRLDLLLERLAAGELVRLWEEELGTVERTGCRTLFAVLAGTLSEPALLTICQAVLLRSFLVARLSRGEWAAAARWAEAIAGSDAELGGLLCLLTWPPAAETWTRQACERAEGVLVYGHDETVARIRQWTPAGTRFVGRGHRVSLAVVGAGLGERELTAAARALARDVALHEQRGCLSPHYVLVEETPPGRALGFGLRLAAALQQLAREWPAPLLAEQDMLRWRAALNRWRMRAALAREVSLWEGGAASGPRFCVVASDPGPTLPDNPGNRFVFVLPVRDWPAIEALLCPLRGRLGTVGIACPDARAEAWIARARSWDPQVRVAAVGRMQDPPLTWRDGGIGNLEPWVMDVGWRAEAGKG